MHHVASSLHYKRVHVQQRCGPESAQLLIALHTGAAGCCTSSIKASGELCEDSKMAPCVNSITDTLPNVVAASTATVTLTCGDGVVGVPSGTVCCAPGCGDACGGGGCSGKGQGGSDCCVGIIAEVT
jgi:hypothetical protein